ncbi:MAG: hypothetical protein Q4B22_03685 [Eubacteriales bacterium]|nr:hypothetical protein [Eubacteriales bacterium]
MNEKNYVQYDYLEIPVSSDKLSMLLDGYESFGWKEDVRLTEKNQKILLRRPRHIMNKAELTRLQRNFEACIDEIQRMEKARELNAVLAAIATGLSGCAFLAGAVFAFLGDPPLIWLMILLAIPGFACWMFPFRVKRMVLDRETNRLIPLIEGKYDEIYTILNKGKRLI